MKTLGTAKWDKVPKYPGRGLFLKTWSFRIFFIFFQYPYCEEPGSRIGSRSSIQFRGEWWYIGYKFTYLSQGINGDIIHVIWSKPKTSNQNIQVLKKGAKGTKKISATAWHDDTICNKILVYIDNTYCHHFGDWQGV